MRWPNYFRWDYFIGYLHINAVHTIDFLTLKCECQSDPELAQVILGNDLNKLQTVLRARYNERSEARRQQEEEMVSCSALSKRKVISS